jgi:hypothetical protein
MVRHGLPGISGLHAGHHRGSDGISTCRVTGGADHRTAGDEKSTARTHDIMPRWMPPPDQPCCCTSGQLRANPGCKRSAVISPSGTQRSSALSSFGTTVIRPVTSAITVT